MTRKLSLAALLFAVLLTACDDSGQADLVYKDENEPITFPEEPQESSADEALTFSEEPQENDLEEGQENLAGETHETLQAELREQIASAECPFDEPGGFDIVCGYLQVPENRTLSDSRPIEIAYAIVYTTEDEDRPPIVYLAGGPGGSAIDDFVSDPEGWDYPFTRTRDLILIDQRGTGYSWPTLDCPELDEEVAFDDENPEFACHDRLVAEGIDLTAYNTAENAADVDALREQLGIAEWDLLGISYGTRLALNIMRDYPEGVRSAVLDSVFPPNADTPVEEALTPYWSLQLLFEECASDEYCAGNYPDLETVFLDTVEMMNDSPLDGVYGDDLAFTVTQALNDTNLIPLVPMVIYAVAGGDTGALDQISIDEYDSARQRFQEGEDRSDSEGMFNSVICHEEYIFGDYETAEARVVAEVPEAIEAVLLQQVADLFNVCSYWGAGEAAPLENEPVSSDIPTLILAGQYDVATPPEWAALASETLSNSFLYNFPGTGHSILSVDDCAVAITAEFLDNPDIAPDGSCIDDIEWPYFE